MSLHDNDDDFLYCFSEFFHVKVLAPFTSPNEDDDGEIINEEIYSSEYGGRSHVVYRFFKPAHTRVQYSVSNPVSGAQSEEFEFVVAATIEGLELAEGVSYLVNRTSQLKFKADQV